MATEEKTFDALLSEAPLYQKSNTVTLTGALARSPEEGKFALMQADGSAVTLDSSAVKSHTVIGSSFGQQIVQVEVDAEKVPKEVTDLEGPTGPVFNGLAIRMTWPAGHLDRGPLPILPKTVTAPLQDNVFTAPMMDHPVTNPVADGVIKPLYSDVHTGIADHHTGVLNDTINTGIADHHTGLAGDVPTLPGDPGYPQPAGYPPFSLATGHQAPAEAMARMEALAYGAPLARRGTDPNIDKSPIDDVDDGTFPVWPPLYRNGRRVYTTDY